MPIFVKEIKDAGIGAFTAKDIADAYCRAERSHGEHNVISVDYATKDDLNHIRSLGGFVPEEE